MKNALVKSTIPIVAKQFHTPNGIAKKEKCTFYQQIQFPHRVFFMKLFGKGIVLYFFVLSIVFKNYSFTPKKLLFLHNT